MDDPDISIFREEASEAVNRILDRADFNGDYEHVTNEIRISKREFYNNDGDPEERPTTIEVVLLFEEV